MLKKISQSVYSWSEIHGETRGEPYLWNSYAIHIEDENVLALVDPLSMSSDEMREIETLGRPTHILLTCEYHVRETETYRQKWGCEVLTNEVGLDDFEISIDATFRDGNRLWGLIDLVFVPGVYYPETALLVREEGGILIVGDLVSGGRLDRHIPEGEMGIFPYYIKDLSKARASLRKLLNCSFEAMYFGHGSPVYHGAKEKLRQYLDSDEIWKKLEEEKRKGPPW